MLAIALITLLTPATTPTTQTSTQPSQWRLVWSDEFDQPGKPDAKKWSYERGFVRNHELQFYTPAANVRVEGGVLMIEARHEELHTLDGKHASYTSGSIETRGRFKFTYGRVECRAKLPSGRGMWPAIWTLGSNIDRAGWPACGEIDIMENVGFEPKTIHGTIHTRAYNHVSNTARSAKMTIDDLSTSFHVYTMEWTPEQIELFVDDKPYFKFANEHKSSAQWPYDQPQFIKLNLAVGGEWGAQKGIDDAIFPQTFEVDYVRVFQNAAAAKN